MITLRLSERELAYLLARIAGTGFKWTDDREQQELPIIVHARLIQATGAVSLKPKANKVWDAVRAVSNG